MQPVPAPGGPYRPARVARPGRRTGPTGPVLHRPGVRRAIPVVAGPDVVREDRADVVVRAAPAAGVRIVSFFVTARLAAQSDRGAFVPNVIEQLLAILGQPMPLLTDATQDAHLLGLLDEAAQHCQQRDESLVLLVDGLDEDRGVSTGPAAHSIAAVLPASLSAGMRVIIAGRPNPPVPDDVPEHHPLRDPRIVCRLSASVHARAREREMNEALRELVDGPSEKRILIGLLVAAGGGLTAADLADLAELVELVEPSGAAAGVTGRLDLGRAGCSTAGWPAGPARTPTCSVMSGPPGRAGRDRPR